MTLRQLGKGNSSDARTASTESSMSIMAKKDI